MSKTNNIKNQQNNIVDPREIKEWVQSLEGIIAKLWKIRIKRNFRVFRAESKRTSSFV